MHFPVHQVHAVIGVLIDDTDPMVTVMKLEKAPQESYADIGGLDKQIMEIKVGTGHRLFSFEKDVKANKIAKQANSHFSSNSMIYIPPLL